MKPLWQYFDSDGNVDMAAFNQDGLAWIADVQRRDAVQKAEREVLEACVAWVLASDIRVEDSTRLALLSVGMRYCALLEAESKLRNQ